MSFSLQDFLNDEQSKLVAKTVQDIVGRLRELPVRFASILLECQKADITYLHQIDPEGSIIIEKLTKLNEEAIYRSFQAIGEEIIKIIIKNAQVYEQQRTLRFLKKQISDKVNAICGCEQFSLRLQTPHNKFGSSLWDCMHQELIEISMGISGFLHIRNDMFIDQPRRDIQVEIFLQLFRQKFEGKTKLSKIYTLSQKLETEMNQIKSESCFIDSCEEDDEWSQLIEQIDQIEREEEQLQAVEQFQKQENEEPNARSQNKGGFFTSLKAKANTAFQNVKAIISKNSAYQQKQITEIDLAQHLQNFIQNLESCHQISDNQKRQIEKMRDLNLQELQKQLQGEFSAQELCIIQYAINYPAKKWNDHQNSIENQNELSKRCTCLLIDYTKQLHQGLSYLAPGNHKQPNGEFLLTAFLYKILQKDYCSFTKRYLSKVLRVLQKQIDRKTGINLRGALRILQTSSLNPTKMANLLYNQKPQRSNAYDQSAKSMIYMKNNVFENDKKVQEQTQQCLKQIRMQCGFKEALPEVELIRLNSSNQSKIVTICISGFLSEDSSKDLEWMGLIRALENTELYALGWKSSTLKETGMYLGKIGMSLVLNPINLSGPAGILANVMRVGGKVVNQYQNNPFASAHGRATIVGTYLAELIHTVFPDRFINLVGFSLGNQVLASCLARLASQGRLNLISKVVTLGAAANLQNMQEFLKNSPNSLQLINIWSEKDFAIRYIYRLCRMGAVALGSGDLPSVSGHEVSNIRASKFVKSHMQFRTNLYGIGLLTGLAYD